MDATAAKFVVKGTKGTWRLTVEDLLSVSDVPNPVRGLARHTGCPVRVAVEALLWAGVDGEKVTEARDAYLTQLGRKVCGRCGGTGKHGPEIVWGGFCYKCGGLGTVESRRRS